MGGWMNEWMHEWIHEWMTGYLVHVLREVSEKGKLLVEEGGNLVAAHRAHTQPLAKLDVTKENKKWIYLAEDKCWINSLWKKNYN